MVKKMVYAAFAAVVISAPSVADAQLFTGTLTASSVGSRQASVPGYGTGGGFSGVFQANGSPFSLTFSTFDNFLMWCVDPDRVALAGPADYALYSYSGFAIDDPFAWGGTQAERRARLSRVASGVSTMAGAPNGATGRPARDAGQAVAWGAFTGDDPLAGNPSFNGAGSYVLVYNPINLEPGFREPGQTFMFQTDFRIVPEPGSFALMASALAGLGIVARRRKNIA